MNPEGIRADILPIIYQILLTDIKKLINKKKSIKKKLQLQRTDCTTVQSGQCTCSSHNNALKQVFL